MMTGCRFLSAEGNEFLLGICNEALDVFDALLKTAFNTMSDTYALLA